MKDFPLGKVLIETVDSLFDRSLPIGISLSNIFNKRNMKM